MDGFPFYQCINPISLLLISCEFLCTFDNNTATTIRTTTRTPMDQSSGAHGHCDVQPGIFFPLATALSKQSIIYYNSISIGIYALFSLHPLTTWDPPQSHLVYKLN